MRPVQAPFDRMGRFVGGPFHDEIATGGQVLLDTITVDIEDLWRGSPDVRLAVILVVAHQIRTCFA